MSYTARAGILPVRLPTCDSQLAFPARLDARLMIPSVLHKTWQNACSFYFAGFPEPPISKSASTAHQAANHRVEKTEQEMERQPMLEAIPWEPHHADLQP